ncbi:MAG: 50S ribosomal protein L4 [Candidatus Caldarchaeum sp.]|nr:50S ribosomal protein L4 [Candidatus Caldarchaeum sp.]MDW8435459.1 50S ribosomal protein L4 [Candidatus Caldarchaeum sp.]
MNFTASLVLRKTEPVFANVYRVDGTIGDTTSLPWFFNSPLRPDLVTRAFIHLSTHKLQPKGVSKMSGHKHSVESWGPGFGMARISRVKGRGTPKYGAGGMVPSAVGGRPTHPPTTEKKIHKSINKKELRNAFLSALAFTADPKSVRERGHRIPDGIQTPFVVEDAFETVEKTAEARKFLVKIGLEEELERCSAKKIRAGKGKMRGRRYKRRKGPIIVVGDDRGIGKSAGNIPGVEVVKAKDLSVLHLAPGGKPGRLALFTQSALKMLEERLK